MCRHLRGRHILNVRLTAVQQRDHALADVEADHGEPGLGKLHRQWQADVTEADDRDDGIVGLNARQQSGIVHLDP